MTDDTPPPPAADAVPVPLVFLSPGLRPDLLGPPARATDPADAATGALAPFTPEAVAAALQAGQPCAVVWQSPAGALSQALRAGEAPSRALARWQETADAVLALFRQHRRRLLLVAEDMFTAAAPAEARAQALARLGRADPGDLPAPDSPDALADVLADLAIPRLDALRGRIEELHASSLAPYPAAFPPEQLDQAAAVLVESRNTLALHQRQIAEQTASLSAQLAAAKDREAASAATIGTLQQTLAALQAERQGDLARSGTLERELAEARQDNARLGDQAAKAESEITRLQAEMQAAAQAAGRQIDTLAAQMQDSLDAAALLRDQLAEDQKATAALLKRQGLIARDLAARTESEAAIRAQLAEERADHAATRKRMETLSQDLAGVQAAVQTATGQIDALTTRLQEAHSANALLRDQLAEDQKAAAAQLAQERAAIAAMRAQVETLSQDLASVHAAARTASGQVDALNTRLHEARSTNALLRDQLAEDQKAKTTLLARHDQARDQTEQARTETAIRADLLARERDAVAATREQVETLSHELTRVQAAARTAAEQIDAMTAQLQEARSANAQLRDQLAEGQKAAAALLAQERDALSEQTQAALLRSETEARQEIGLLRAQIRQLQSQIAQERSRPAPQDPGELGRLTEALATAERALSRALSDLRAEATSRAEAERRAQGLADQLDRRQSHEQDLIAAREQIARIMQDDTGLLDTIAAQQRTLEAQSAREAELAAELAELHGRESGLAAEVTALHAEIERIMASRSWKVTEPLRGARRLLHKPASETSSSEE